jgi:hypothetical protein
VISLVVAARQEGGDWPTRIPDVRVWRGPRAPAAPGERPLCGVVEEHAVDSAALHTARQVTVYQPPDPGRPVPGWAGVVPQRISGAARSAGIRHYLAAGTLEPGFRQSTRRWADRLGRAGLPCRHEE